MDMNYNKFIRKCFGISILNKTKVHYISELFHI